MLNKKSLITFFLITLPIGVALNYLKSQTTIPKKYSIEEITANYNSGEKDLALKKIKESGEKLTKTTLGCNLVISICAENRKWNQLYTYSKNCLKNTPVPDIAYDGIALSMKEQGQIKEAIKKLKTYNNKNDRLLSALGHLYLYDNDQINAKKTFIKLIQSSNIWSAWFSKVLKMKDLILQKDFVIDLIKIILEKKDIFPSQEQTLLQHAKNFKVVIANKLEQRLRGKYPKLM
jgi:hypothetical protein